PPWRRGRGHPDRAWRSGRGAVHSRRGALRRRRRCRLNGGWLLSLPRCRRLQQLHEDAQPRRGLQEGDLAVRARSWRLVDQLDALVLQVAQVLTDIRRAEAQVVQARPAALDEARHGRVDVGRLQQLDQHVGGLDEGDLELSLGHIDGFDNAQAEFLAVEVHRVVNAGHGDAHVVDRQWRLRLGLPKRTVRGAKWVHRTQY